MIRFLSILCLVIIAFSSVLLPGNAKAISTKWFESKEISARLIAGNYDYAKAQGTPKEALLGIEFKMSGKWKTYWRTPGDGGLPMSIDWQKSENVQDIKHLWPAPTRYVAYETIETLGYSNEVIFPLIVTPIDDAKPIIIKLTADFAACDEICVFHKTDFALDLQPAFKHDEYTKLIQDYVDKTPATNGTHGITIDSAFVDNNHLIVNATSKELAFNAPDILVELSDNFRFPKAEVTFSDNQKIATFKIPYEILLEGEALAGKIPLFTLVDKGRAVEALTSVNKPIEKPIISPSSNLFYILFAAFIGGLILNIMPCVLPVLSLKLMGVMKHGGKDTHYIRFSFLMSVAGILTSFIVLAVIVLGLKSAGTVVGWGFHFHEPMFLIALVLVINLFAANEWALYEIRLPTWLSTGLSSQLDARDHTALGHFFTGAFATLLATPCSAPFLGVAISFALSRGPLEILLIFLVVGLGLAAPYLLFAVFPGLVSKMPKPGAWMVKVKHFLGILLVATSIWLITILASQLGIWAAFALALLSFAMFKILWLIKHGKTRLILLASVVFLSFAIPLAVSQTQSKTIDTASLWKRFDEASITTLVSEGNVVFVDVTADWCLTCKFNKLNVINTEEVLNELTKHNVIAMKADYTNPDPVIARYLASFNRYGIPFNVVYGPSAPEGITLPELLSTEEVLNALENAQ